MAEIPPVYSTAIAQILKELRNESGYPQEAVEAMTGIGRPLISNYERAATLPSLKNLRKLCKDVYKCEVSEFHAKVEAREKDLLKSMKKKTKRSRSK